MSNVDTVKGILHDVILKAVVQQVVAAIPILGSRFLAPITSFIISKIGEKIFEVTYAEGSVLVLEMRVGSQKRAYEEATERLKSIIRSTDNEAVELAKEEYRKRLADLIRFGRT